VADKKLIRGKIPISFCAVVFAWVSSNFNPSLGDNAGIKGALILAQQAFQEV
jgi:hypothetical protein